MSVSVLVISTGVHECGKERYQMNGDSLVKRTKEGNGDKRLRRVTIQGLFFVVYLLGCRDILQYVFGIGKEYFSPPERHKGEEEEDGPSGADEDDHDGVPHDEPRQVENVRQDTDDGDETDIRKPKTEIINRQ